MKSKWFALVSMLTCGLAIGYLLAEYYFLPRDLPLIKASKFGVGGITYSYYAISIFFALIIAWLAHTMIYDDFFRAVMLRYMLVMVTSTVIAWILVTGVIVPFAARYGITIRQTGDYQAALTIMMVVFLCNIDPPKIIRRIKSAIHALIAVTERKRTMNEPRLKWL